jgi:hypothetical protein
MINRITTRIRNARRNRVYEYAVNDSELFMAALQVVQQIAQPPRAPRW